MKNINRVWKEFWIKLPALAVLLCLSSNVWSQTGGSQLTQAEINKLKALLPYLFLVDMSDGQGGTVKAVQVRAANLQVVNSASGATSDVNGTGNIIIGFNEANGTDNRTGSHNLILGSQNEFTSYSGIVSGFQNSSGAPHASVIGGTLNTAAEVRSVIVSGKSNITGGTDSAIVGGFDNDVGGLYAVVAGGQGNSAQGVSSSILGGQDNTMTANATWCTGVGGAGNTIDDATYSLIAGGSEHLIDLQGSFASAFAGIFGGFGNSALGVSGAATLGGTDNLVTGPFSTISGGRHNVASGGSSTVSGGDSNTASGLASSVGGGLSHTSSGTDDWRAGTLFEDL